MRAQAIRPKTSFINRDGESRRREVRKMRVPAEGSLSRMAALRSSPFFGSKEGQQERERDTDTDTERETEHRAQSTAPRSRGGARFTPPPLAASPPSSLHWWWWWWWWWWWVVAVPFTADGGGGRVDPDQRSDRSGTGGPPWGPLDMVAGTIDFPWRQLGVRCEVGSR